MPTVRTGTSGEFTRDAWIAELDCRTLTRDNVRDLDRVYQLLELHMKIQNSTRLLDQLQTQRANTRAAVTLCVSTASIAGAFSLANDWCDSQQSLIAKAVVVAGLFSSLTLLLCNIARSWEFPAAAPRRFRSRSE